MSKTLWFLIFCALVLLGCGLVLWSMFPDWDASSRMRRRPVTSPPRSAPVEPPEATLEEAAEPPPPVFQPRSLPITGRVVDGELEPVTSARVALGDESVEVGDGGRFRLEDRIRREPATLSVFVGEREVARYPRVIVGDMETSPYDELEMIHAFDIRWSINLCHPEVFQRTVASEADTTAGRGDRAGEETGTESRAGEPASGDLPAEGSTAPPAPTDPLARSAFDASFDPSGLESRAPSVKFSGMPPLADGEYLTIDTVLLEEWGPGGAVHVEGRAALPDGLHVSAALYALGDRLTASARPATIHDGRYRLVFPMGGGRRLHSGALELRIYFSPHQEDYLVMQELRQTRPDIDWESLDDYQVSQRVFAGTPEEEAAQNRKEVTYYSEVVPRVRGLFEMLRKRYAQTLKLSGGWDPDALEALERSMPSSTLAHDVNAQGHFDEARWRRFLDEQWRPRVMELLSRHERVVGEKFPRAKARLQRALTYLRETSHDLSQNLYARFGLAPHENDQLDVAVSTDLGAAVLIRTIAGDLQYLASFTSLETLPGASAPDADGEDDAPDAKEPAGGLRSRVR